MKRDLYADVSARIVAAPEAGATPWAKPWSATPGANTPCNAGSGQRARRDPLYDINPWTGVTIEVFYADRALETFGRRGAGWFWWARRRGRSPNGPATGPFSTSYAAYRHAMIDGEHFASPPPSRFLAQGINAVSMEKRLSKYIRPIPQFLSTISIGSERGTRTPDPRIMIPVL
jgi:hypothetical protein